MEYEIKPARGIHFNFKELWTFRELVYFFTLRDLQLKYKQTVLGAAWAILQPFLLMLVFTLFLSSKINIAHTDLPYSVYVFSGLIIWNIFSFGIGTAGNSMVNNAHIIRKIYFPRLIIPISSVLSTLVDFVMTLVLFIAIVVYYHLNFNVIDSFFVMLASVLITLLTTFGLGSLLAALNVKYRDVRYVIPFMIQILMFVSPVIYPISMITNETLRDILMLNPLAGAIDLFRDSLTGRAFDWMVFFKSLFIALLFLIAGISYFRKTEYYFADLA